MVRERLNETANILPIFLSNAFSVSWSWNYIIVIQNHPFNNGNTTCSYDHIYRWFTSEFVNLPACVVHVVKLEHFVVPTLIKCSSLIT